MREMLVGDLRLQIVAVRRGDLWTAHARRADTGERVGIDCSGESEHQAVEQAARWLDWQHEHAIALEALQHAERAYHRTVAGSAFASPVEGPTPLELQQESLRALEAARLRLDEVRARRPA